MFFSIVLMEYTTVEWSRWNSEPMASMLIPVISRMIYIDIWRAALTLGAALFPADVGGNHIIGARHFVDDLFNRNGDGWYHSVYP